MAALLLATGPARAQDEQQPLPDLVANIYALSLENGVLELDGSVRNLGSANYAGGDDVVVQSSDGVKRYLKMPEIPEGSEYKFSITIRGAGAEVKVAVLADPRDQVRELFEGNNRAERRTSRPADLLVAGLRLEAPPSQNQPAQLVAEVRDRLRSVSGIEPTDVQVHQRASLRAPGGQAVDIMVDEFTVPDFTGVHLMPVDVRLPADSRERVGGSRTADLEVEVCVNLDGLVAELGEECAEGVRCNNCSTVVVDDVVLPEAPLSDAERTARERALAVEAATLEAEQEATERAERKAQEEAARKAEEAAKAVAEAARKAEEEAARKAEEEAARKAEEEAARKAAEAQAAAADEQARAEAAAAAAQAAAEEAERAAQAEASKAAALAAADARKQAAHAADTAARLAQARQDLAASQQAAEQQAAEQQAAAEQAAEEQAAEEQAAAEGDGLAEATPVDAMPVAADVQAAPAAPDLVVADVRVERGVLTSPVQVRVEVRDLHGAVAADGADLPVRLVHSAWRLQDVLEGTVSRADLADDGRAEVVLEGSLRGTPGRCGPSPGERTHELVTVSVGSVGGELDARNNSRQLRLELMCQGPDAPTGLGPMPDPALSAAEAYIVNIDGRDYLQLGVHLQNLGTPIRTDDLLVDAQVGERSWLPASWTTPVSTTVPLAKAVVDEPLSALPPRRSSVCGVGGRSWPVDELPAFARSGGGTGRIDAANSVEITLGIGTSPPIRQLNTRNDQLVVSVPLDRDLTAPTDSVCGGRPARLGLEDRRVRHATRPANTAGLATSISLSATVDASMTNAGVQALRGEIVQTAAGRVPQVEYAWHRNGSWAGGGTVDVPANAPAIVQARDLGDSTATWELVIDPAGLLEDADSSDDVAVLELGGEQ